MKTTIEVFQDGGADETLNQAMRDFADRNPQLAVTGAEFKYAYPGRPGEGRWVGIEITHS